MPACSTSAARARPISAAWAAGWRSWRSTDCLPAWALIPVAIVAAALFGAAWAAIPAWLQAKRGSHIVITTIMFNFLAAALMVYLMVNVLIAPGSMTPQSRDFTAAGKLPSMHEVLAAIGIQVAPSPLNLSIVLARRSAASPSGCSSGTRRGAMSCAPWATIPRPRIYAGTNLQPHDHARHVPVGRAGRASSASTR